MKKKIIWKNHDEDLSKLQKLTNKVITARENACIGGAIAVENKLGYHGLSKEEKTEVGRLGANAVLEKYTKEELQKRGWGNGKPKKPVLQYDLDGNFIKEWESVTDAAIEIGSKREHIYAVVKGKRNSHKKSIWKYKDE